LIQVKIQARAAAAHLANSCSKQNLENMRGRQVRAEQRIDTPKK
jgi:hypothetical protein